MSWCNVVRRRTKNQVRAAHRRADVVRHRGKLGGAAALEILDDYRIADRLLRSDRRLIAPPQPYRMAGKCEVARRPERAVAAAEHRDLHRPSPRLGAIAFVCLLPVE
jgi:hypothetical protein